MSQSRLEAYGAYQEAQELFHLVAADMSKLDDKNMCRRLVSQQIASADSISANIEEVYGRLSRKEYVRFFDYSRGSARETRGRYVRMNHWIPADVLPHRVALLDEIIGILSATFRTLSNFPNHGNSVNEDFDFYDAFISDAEIAES